MKSTTKPTTFAKPVPERKLTCTTCGRKHPQSKMVALMLRFTTIGRGFKILRSRTTEYLCPACLKKHPGWNAESYARQKTGVPVAGAPKDEGVKG